MIDLPQAYTRIDEFAAQKMSEHNIPGLALALTDRDRLLRVSTLGLADVAARKAVTPDTLFEIGSISKSFTCIALLQLCEEGRLDVHWPVTKVLPWFQVRSAFAPITLHHLMSHTAGIVNGADISNDSRFDVYALRETETSAPPGERFYYSNVAFQALGYVLEDVLGQPYRHIIQSRILDPLGMDATQAIITHGVRERLAVGYGRLYDDRPSHPSHPLVPATWVESSRGDGSICSTPADMAIYLRMLLNRGQGAHARLLSDESFELLAQRVIETERGVYYGYGLDIYDVDGHTCIGHSGGMIGYCALMMGDVEEGVGVIVLINGPGETLEIAQYALRVLRAALRGEELPALPPVVDATRVENAADYAGVYRAGDKAIEISAEGDQLILKHAGERITLEKREPDRFFVPHADFERFLLIFRREAERVVEAFHGPDGYANEHYTGPATFDAPPAWSAYTGHYRSHNPWSPSFRIVLRKGRLFLIYPYGDEKSLQPLEEGVFRVGEEAWQPERVRFDAIVNGQALRANYSGCDYHRVPTHQDKDLRS